MLRRDGSDAGPPLWWPALSVAWARMLTRRVPHAREPPLGADPRCSPGYEPESYPLASMGRNVVWRDSLVLTTSIIERE